MSATSPQASAQALLESRDCKTPGCVGDASGSPRRGRWANLCDECSARLKEAARLTPRFAAESSNGHGSREAVRAAVKGETLEARAKALAPAAKRLERCVAQRKAATADAKAALADFNDALNALREGAQALLSA